MRNQHQSIDARCRDGHARCADRAIIALEVSRDGFPQRRDTWIGRVEGFAIIQRCLGGFAHEIRRDRIRFPKPEGNDILHISPNFRDLTDQRAGDFSKGGAGRGFEAHGAALARDALVGQGGVQVPPHRSTCQLPDYPGTSPRVLPSAKLRAVQPAGLQRLPLLAITRAHTLKSRHIGHA